MRCKLAILLLVAVATPALAGTSAFGEPVDATELSAMRGGFQLPSGIDVSLAVESQTMLNGAILLRSIFAATTGAPQLSVFVGDGSAAPAQSASADASGSTTRFTVNTAANAPANVAQPGLEHVAVAPGQSVMTPSGVVTLRGSDTSGRVELATPDLSTSHLFGGAFGSLTMNSADNRAIDTTTTVSVTLANVSPDVLGSAILRADAVAVESARMLSR